MKEKEREEKEVTILGSVVILRLVAREAEEK